VGFDFERAIDFPRASLNRWMFRTSRGSVIQSRVLALSSISVTRWRLLVPREVSIVTHKESQAVDFTLLPSPAPFILL
jgi:hypothetical protein